MVTGLRDLKIPNKKWICWNLSSPKFGVNGTMSSTSSCLTIRPSINPFEFMPSVSALAASRYCLRHPDWPWPFAVGPMALKDTQAPLAREGSSHPNSAVQSSVPVLSAGTICDFLFLNSVLSQGRRDGGKSKTSSRPKTANVPWWVCWVYCCLTPRHVAPSPHPNSSFPLPRQRKEWLQLRRGPGFTNSVTGELRQHRLPAKYDD